MNKKTFFFLLFYVVGCANINSDQRYIGEVQGIGDSPNYPLVAAGFKRGKILTYGPEMTDFSTAYNLITNENQIGSTIYLFPFSQNLKDMFELEKQSILAFHKEAKILNTATLVLTKNGIEYKTLQATFEYQENFMGKIQKIFSQLMLWKHKDRYIKLRSTSPYSQKDQNLAKNSELLDTVNWAFR